MRRLRRGALPLVTWVAVSLVAGCAGRMHGGPQANDRPIGEDLPALLPSGADAVLDIDVVQLDGWATARRLLELMPPEGRARLAQLGEDPLAQLEALAVALYRAGSAEAETTIVARGKLDWERLSASVAGGVESDYHGAVVIDGTSEALARISPSLFAFGSRAGVRRVCDVARKDDEGFRTAATDKALRLALGHAPTAKLGRPAILAALVPTQPLREKLRGDKWETASDLDWGALSLAVGDGFDVGLIAGTHGPVEAAALEKTMKARATELKSQATVRLLGLQPFVEPFIVVAKDNEIHVAYRLGAMRVDQLVTRLAQMQSFGKRKAERP